MTMPPGLEAATLQHRQRIFSFAYHLLSNREEAEDVTQDVLVKMLAHAQSLDPERIGSWLLRVTRNACYDLLRKRRVRTGAGTEELDDEETATELPAADPDPRARAEAAQFRARVKGELDGLDEPYRSVVILREIQDLSYREIADALEMPLNTVRVVLHRGRKKLRERLREEYEDVSIH